MFDKLSSLLARPQRAPELPRKHLAMAVLLVEAARADFADQAEERAVMRDALVHKLGLDAAEADTLVERAYAQSREAVSLHRFLAVLNAELDAEAKRGLVEWLWRVVYADGRVDPQEEARIRQIADLLFVSHADFVRLRHKVEAESGA
jgi:uncharacterized tellurite resistance protein B-like protein